MNPKSLQNLCSIVFARHTLGWEDDIWLPKPIKTVIKEAIADDAWERLAEKSVSLLIGAPQSESFTDPYATLSHLNLLYVADTFTNTVKVFDQEDGRGPIFTHNVASPHTIMKSHNILVCSRERTTFDLFSDQPPIEHRLGGTWRGSSWFCSLLDGGDLLVFAWERVDGAQRSTLERFTRGPDSEWIHQPAATIRLPDSSFRSLSFTCDPATDRVWWSWATGPRHSQHRHIGIWDITSGDQVFQREISVHIVQLNATLDGRGCLLAFGFDSGIKMYRLAQDGTIIDQCDPNLGPLKFISTSADGTIQLSSLFSVIRY